VLDLVIERNEPERGGETLATPVELRVLGLEGVEDETKHFPVAEVSPRKWTMEGPILL
jgi:hypothetical protein